MSTDSESEEDAQFEAYLAQIRTSGGFDVDDFDISCATGMIMYGGKGNRETIAFSKLALHHFNLSQDTDFEFVEVDHYNRQLVRGDLCYITFKAKSISNNAGSILTFQAQVWEDIPGRNKELPFEFVSCSLKPGQVQDLVRRPHRPEKQPKKKQLILGIQAAKISRSKDIGDSDLARNHEWLSHAFVPHPEYTNYRKQVLDSKGFDVKSNIPLMFTGQIIPLETFEFDDNLIQELAEIALCRYKRLRAKATKQSAYLVFSRVEKANAQTDSFDLAKMPFKAKHANFYITFTALNKTEGRKALTLQTLFWKRLVENGRWRIIMMYVTLLPTSK